MTPYISIFAVRSVAEARDSKLNARKYAFAVKKALVTASGVTYPNFQTAPMWISPAEADSDHILFVFDRRPPTGDFRLERDCSWTATRRLLDDEQNGPVIYLESLTWEFVCSMVFMERLIAEVGRPGEFRVGITLSGFNNAFVDWAGFAESRPAGQMPLSNWRFRPGTEIATFEADVVGFPVSPDLADDHEVALAGVISDLAYQVVGLRRTHLGTREEARLGLADESVLRVVKTVRATARQFG